MSFWKPIVAALVIFAAGIIFGGAMVGYGVRVHYRQERFEHEKNASRQAREAFPPNFPNAGRDNPRPGNFSNLRLPGVLTKEFLARLDAEVHLTPAQHERIKQVVDEGQQRNKVIMEKVQPELRVEMIETQRRIREILTEEQRGRFEELMKQRRPRPNEDQPRPGSKRNTNVVVPAGDVQLKPN